MNRKQISPERKGIFYVGVALSVIGFISFGSVFLSAVFESAGSFNGFPGIHGGSGFMDMRWAPARAFGGVALIGIGQFLCRIGKMGLAGAGVVLDPEKARQDVEPWSRMGGGVIKDALDEANIKLGGAAAALPFDEQLRRLHRLREDGIISEAEYQAKKKQILNAT